MAATTPESSATTSGEAVERTDGMMNERRWSSSSAEHGSSLMPMITRTHVCIFTPRATERVRQCQPSALVCRIYGTDIPLAHSRPAQPHMPTQHSLPLTALHVRLRSRPTRTRGAEPCVSLCCVNTDATPSNTKSNPTNMIATVPPHRTLAQQHTQFNCCPTRATLDASVHTRNDTDTQSPTHDVPCESRGTVQ